MQRTENGAVQKSERRVIPSMPANRRMIDIVRQTNDAAIASRNRRNLNDSDIRNQ